MIFSIDSAYETYWSFQESPENTYSPMTLTDFEHISIVLIISYFIFDK